MEAAAEEIVRLVREEARRRGVRWTTQRQAIVERFIATQDHVTAEELHRRVRAIDPTVSTATVYRTINMLVDLGIAHRRHFGDAVGSPATFELAFRREHHDHLVCLACGRIIEFHRDRIESLQEDVAREYGFTLASHRMELYGTCAACTDSKQKAAPAPS